MKTSKIILFLLLFSISSLLKSFGQTPNVSYLEDGYFDVEYECIMSGSTFAIDIIAFKVTGLINNVTYGIDLDTANIFDHVHYQSKSYLFEVVDDESPTWQEWKWTSPTINIDTIVLEFQGNYSNWEINASQWFTFGAYRAGYGGDYKNVMVSIITPMEISGPSLDCSNPVSFDLLNLPETNAVATWVIKQGAITRASGSGTTASASNLTDGEAEVTFTVDFTSCWLNDLTFKKEFWFGKPVPSILGPDEVECYFPEWYFIDSDSYQWGDFEWSTDYMMDILGTTTGHKARIEGLDEGYGQIFLEVTNTCGSKETRKVVWIDCEFFRMAPNPSDDYVEISLDENKVDFINILEYEVKIYNSQQVLVYNAKTRNSSLQFDTSQFKNGIYYVHLVYNGKTYTKQLVISH